MYQEAFKPVLVWDKHTGRILHLDLLADDKPKAVALYCWHFSSRTMHRWDTWTFWVENFVASGRWGNIRHFYNAYTVTLNSFFPHIVSHGKTTLTWEHRNVCSDHMETRLKSPKAKNLKQLLSISKPMSSSFVFFGVVVVVVAVVEWWWLGSDGGGGVNSGSWLMPVTIVSTLFSELLYCKQSLFLLTSSKERHFRRKSPGFKPKWNLNWISTQLLTCSDFGQIVLFP